MKKPHHHSKPVYLYTPTGFYVREHGSIREAAEALKTSPEAISLVLRKINKTAKTFQFSFEKKDRIEPVVSLKNRMLGIKDQEVKRVKAVEFTDFGIIDNPESIYFGKRKIKIEKLELYANPNTPVDQIVNKYSKSI